MQQVYFKCIKLGVKNTGYVYNRQTGLTFRVQTQPYKNQQICGAGTCLHFQCNQTIHMKYQASFTITLIKT